MRTYAFMRLMPLITDMFFQMKLWCEWPTCTRQKCPFDAVFRAEA